jgi:hypothetical protein
LLLPVSSYGKRSSSITIIFTTLHSPQKKSGVPKMKLVH